jgi:hypothetical protein
MAPPEETKSMTILNLNLKGSVDALGIPKTTISILADITNAEVSRFLRDPNLLVPEKRARAQAVTEDLVYLAAEVFPKFVAENGIKPDLRDIPSLRKLIGYVQEGRAKLAESEARLADSQRQVMDAFEGLKGI